MNLPQSSPAPDKPATIFWPVTLMIAALIGWVAFTEFVITLRDRQYAVSEPAMVVEIAPDMAAPALELKQVPLQAMDMQGPDVRMAAAFPPPVVEESAAAPESVQRTRGQSSTRRVSPIFQATTY